ncbi:MAG: GntR family transcriptional regulator [Lentisphaeria bacterium]|nr:GntR family transcriptional regulator [Lentisphaeria bacterium]
MRGSGTGGKAKQTEKPFSSSFLIRYLRGEIYAGRYRPGEKLESVRQLADRFEVGRQVVLYALGQLVKQGILTSSARRGYFLSPAFQPNRFHRIGYLKNDINPLRSALDHALYAAALYFGYQLIPYHNFESDVPAEDLLKNTADIDGIILTGRGITDQLLTAFARGKLPYVVLGEYAVSGKHPATDAFPVWREDRKRLLRFLKNRRCRRIAVIAGPNTSYSDRRFAEKYARILSESVSGAQVKIVYAREDGYPEISRLLSPPGEPPELLFFCGEQCLGYRKYAEEHPELPRPEVIVMPGWSISLPPGLADLELPGPTPEEYRGLMEELLKKLHCL